MSILEIQMQYNLHVHFNEAKVICALVSSILVRKEFKDKGVALLLALAEKNIDALNYGIQEAISFKLPNVIVEALRFMELLIIKNDEVKM